MVRVAGRRISVAVLALAAWVAVIGAQSGVAAASGPAAPVAPLAPGADSPAHHNGTLDAAGPGGGELVVAERTERASEAAAHDRRLTSRDGRPLDWLAPASLGGVAVAALSSTLARRRHRRLAARSPHFAPSRGPPLLIPS